MTSVFPTSFPTQTVLMPLLNIKGASDAVSVNTRGPANSAPVKYVADSYSDTQIMFQNIVPPNLRTCMEKHLLLTYKVQIAYSYVGRVAEGDYIAPHPFLGGVEPGEYYRNSFPPAAYQDNLWIPSFDQFGNLETSNPLFQFRSLPFNHVCNNLDVKINGQSTTINPSDYADLYPFMGNPAGNGLFNSTTPVYQDVGVVPAVIQGMTGPVDGNGNLQSAYPMGGSSQLRAEGSSYRNQLSPYNAIEARVLAVTYTDYSRTGAQNTDKTPVGADIAEARLGFNIVYEVTITEPLIIPPFSTGEVFTEAGLTRVMTLSLQANMGNLMRLLKIAPGVTVSAGPPPPAALVWGTRGNAVYNFQISMTKGLSVPLVDWGAGGAAGLARLQSTAIPLQPAPEPPYLTVFYASLDAATADGEPAVVVYESDLMQQWTTPNPTVNIGVIADAYNLASRQWSCTSQALRLPSMPETIYVFSRPSKATLNDVTKGPFLNDHFLTIESVQVSFMDRTGLLTTYDSKSLYRMSVKNGYRGSYKQWKYASGSILIINVAEDLCLSPTEAPGQNVYSTFQITVNGTLANFAWTNGMLGPYYFANAAARETLYKIQAPGPPALYGALAYELVVATVIPGKCAIGAGQATFMTEGPSPATLFEETRAGIRTDTADVGLATGGSMSGGSMSGGAMPGWLKKGWAHVKAAGAYGLKQLSRIPPEAIGNVVKQVVDIVQPMLSSGGDDGDGGGGDQPAEGGAFRRRKRHY